MTAASIEFPSVDELESRRDALHREVGMTVEELLEGEFNRTLELKQYLILDELRGIEFLLED